MSKKLFEIVVAVLLAAGAGLNLPAMADDKAAAAWKVHDMRRPVPPKIESPTASTQETPGKAPSDAIVLFDGNDLSQWTGSRAGPAKWLVKDGYMEIAPGTGDIQTVQSFGDCQLHIEWAAPEQLLGDGHDSGNSGVFLMGKYEIQVFDSYRSRIYADGSAGAMYGQYPPQVNACRPAGRWESFDVIFHRPHFDESGRVTKPAAITVLHNGVLVQDNVSILGATTWMSQASYQAHPEKLPLSLQDHGNPVRYRNIWIRELPKGPQDLPPADEKGISISDELFDRYIGVYGKGLTVTLARDNGRPAARMARQPFFEIAARSQTEFFGTRVDGRLVFDTDADGTVKGLTLYEGGRKLYFEKSK